LATLRAKGIHLKKLYSFRTIQSDTNLALGKAVAQRHRTVQLTRLLPVRIHPDLNYNLPDWRQWDEAKESAI
jgi:hypothetical protein